MPKIDKSRITKSTYMQGAPCAAAYLRDDGDALPREYRATPPSRAEIKFDAHIEEAKAKLAELKQPIEAFSQTVKAQRQ